MANKRAQVQYKDWYASVYHSHDEAADFYNSPQWRKLKRECLYRDCYRCQRCGKRKKASELNAHHIHPRADGGADDLVNLIALCSPCHDFVEMSDARTRSGIVESYAEETPAQREHDSFSAPDPYNRPEWHRWVYGGVKKRR